MIDPDLMFSKHGRGREGKFTAQFCDEYGDPVRRTRYTHPYSYDGYVVWKSRDYRPQSATGTIYSDRLLEWDYDKYERLRKKYFADQNIRGWDNPQAVEAMLREWNDAPNLHLVLIMEYCNQASDYPCWRFDYVTPAPESQKGKPNG